MPRPPACEDTAVSTAPLTSTARKNVEAIAQLEQQLHSRRSRSERLSDRIAQFFGSLGFVAAHVVGIGAWVAANVHLVPGVPAFDPYPFAFLGFVVGVEFIFLTTFVLINQNVQSRRQEQWGHLTLQVCLLTEQEATRTLQMLHQVCDKLGIHDAATDAESKDMAKATPVNELVAEIEKAREADSDAVEAAR